MGVRKYTFGREQIEQMRGDAQSLSYNLFGQKWGMPQKSVGSFLRRHGIQRDGGAHQLKDKYSAEVKAKALDMASDGKTLKAISVATGVPTGTVSDWVCRARDEAAEKAAESVVTTRAHWPGSCFRLIVDSGRYWLWPRSMDGMPGIAVSGYIIAEGVVNLAYESGDLIAKARNEKIHPAAVDKVRRYVAARLMASKVQPSMMIEALAMESRSHNGEIPDDQRHREIALSARLALQTLGAYTHAKCHKDRAAVAAIFASNIEAIKKDRAA